MSQFMRLLYILGFLTVWTVPGNADVLEEGRLAFDQKQYSRAVTLFQQGNAEGNLDSTYYLARMVEMNLAESGDKKIATKLYLHGAQRGHVASLNRIALMHYRGEFGFKTDYKTAGKFFKKAALAGNANAQFNYGKMIFEQKLGPQDMDTTLKWYRKAAANNHVLALNTLGALYRIGGKTKKDVARSKAHYLRSAKLGNPEGLFQTGRYILLDQLEHEDNDRLIEAHMYLNLSSAFHHDGARKLMVAVEEQLSTNQLLQAQKMAVGFEFERVGQ